MANSDVNVVVLVGRLTRDSELRYTNSGTAICRFSLAVNRRKRSGDSWDTEANFFDVVLWGKQGEALQRYLEKGKQVSVSGELRQSRWEQNGQNRSRVEIVASTLQLLGGGSGGNSSGKRPEGSASGPKNEPPSRDMNGFGGDNADFSGPDDFDDDIPF